MRSLYYLVQIFGSNNPTTQLQYQTHLSVMFNAENFTGHFFKIRFWFRKRCKQVGKGYDLHSRVAEKQLRKAFLYIYPDISDRAITENYLLPEFYSALVTVIGS